MARAAEDAAAAADAAKTFVAAQKLYDARDFAAALPLFRKALEGSGSPNARLYVARCLRELGKLPEAFEEMATALRDATARAETEARYAPTRDAAAAERALLERRVGRLVVAIANAPDGVQVTIDGVAVPPERIGAPIAVEPGIRTVTVTPLEGEAVRREVTVPAGDTRTLALALPGESGERPPPAPTPPPSEPDRRSGGGVRIAGFVVAGLGVAGMGLFAVTGVMANGKFSSLEDECGGVRCTDPKYADTVDSGKTLDTLATVGLIAGAAGIAAGTAMIIFGGPSDRGEGTPTAAAGVSITPGGAALRGVIAF